MGTILKALMNFLPQADIVYLVLFLGVTGVGGYYLHKYHAAINYETTVKAESASTLATAEKTISTDTTDYKAALAQEKLDHANDNLAAVRLHNTDVTRLRAATARQTNTVLRGTPASTAGTASGTGSPEGLSGLSEQAVVCQRLSDALDHDDNVLTIERAERDALTGK